MGPDELRQVLDSLRRFGGEPSDVGVKTAGRDLPRTTVETLSAFANSDGGVLILGVDEEEGFRPVDLSDPVKLRNDLVSAASDQLTPPLRLAVDLVDVDGHVLVVAEVDPLPSEERPCYVTSKGISGAFVRVGDGDRRMTQTEIGMAIANRGQPVHDAEPVLRATVEDLDRTAVLRSLERIRASSQALRAVDDATALRRMRVLVPDPDGRVVPSLAGLLTFGTFPQEHFPQLTISVVVLPAASGALAEEGLPRFVDNPVIRGSIPELVSETVAALRRHLRVRGFVDGDGRREQLDLPVEAIREAVVNAVLHRDYSPVSRGTQIQVELHPDRLLVRSPGSLFGPVTVEDLGAEGVSSSRNAFLAQLLADTYLPRSERLVAENRASGIPAMIRDLRSSGLPRPRFRNLPSRFEVELSNSELLDPATREWIRARGGPGLTDVHRIALALMRHGNDVTNAHLREYGADRLQATEVLRDLVALGLAERHGGRRYARYALAPDAVGAALQQGLLTDDPGSDPKAGPAESVRAVLRHRGSATAAELTTATGWSRSAVLAVLRDLVGAGHVVTEGAPRSPRRRYRWIDPGRTTP